MNSDRGSVSPLDEHFAQLMQRLHGRPEPAIFEAARLVSSRRAEGHTCVRLDEAGMLDAEKKLRNSPVIGSPGEFKPLILDRAGRLYLQRYWQYEHDLAAAILRRIKRPAHWDAAKLSAALERFFGTSDEANDQRRAAETAVQRSFCVITGGPGTGKTHTVAVVLALLHEQARAGGQPLRVKLAAPTGKAAARMKDAIGRALDRPEFSDFRDVLDTEATTIHRLLGRVPNSASFRHHADRQLATDVVIVDEASMIDLALMATLVAAVPNEARLIMLGDKDQLASVEAGNLLGDICNSAAAQEREPAISSHIVELKKNYRFGEAGALSQLSGAVNAGDAEKTLALLRNAGDQVRSQALPTAAALRETLRERVVEGFRASVSTPDPATALQQLNDFRILCAVRGGPFGVENLNAIAEAALTSAGLVQPDRTHYCGRPVLILRNDYQLHLFNGDIGIILPDADEGGELRAWFFAADGSLRRLLPARLPEHETVFAMTVHKSQGSEFRRVLLILPDRESPVLTRELVYTGLTRAREGVELWHEERVFRTAIQRQVVRSSGLRDALWSA